MDEKPEWWAANDRLRRNFDLPPYEPPRFADDTYIHEVVPEIEAEFDVEIRFVGMNTRHGDDWDVHVDGEPIFAIGRRRDRNSNTVYELTAAEFERRLRSELS